MPLETCKEKYLGPGLEDVRFNISDVERKLMCRVTLDDLTDRRASTVCRERAAALAGVSEPPCSVTCHYANPSFRSLERLANQ
jgi:hypothetical protein